MANLKEMIFLLLLPILVEFTVGWDVRSDESCAFIYSNESFGGNSIGLRKGELISDLHTVYEQLDHPTLNTSSFKLQSGCHLKLCGDTDMTGECNQFDGDMSSLPEQWTSPRSVNCLCPNTCDCADVKLRARECARMYLGNSCSHCEAIYTNLKKGDVQEFPSNFRDKVKSVIVSKHCKATIYAHTELDGFVETEELSGEIIKDWEGNVTSYKCSCNDSERQVQASIQNTRPTNLPPLIDVPKTLTHINSLLNSKYKEHPGLIASLQSMRNKRSPTNAYILLLGLTGSGKSTTINLLFDNSTITKVGDIRSTTTDINEYRIPVQVDELGIHNSELRVIDTPGMVDTRGMEQDARYLATLNEFLDKHEDLKKSTPNVILVFAKFSNNRFVGEGSSFVKMLRAIDLFRERLFDNRKYSNVIIVLTHFMSETRAITRKPSNRIKAIKKVVEEYSLFPKPVVVVIGENKPEEANLPNVNGYYKLPNGEFYPRNLFDKMEEALYSGGDPIGEAIIRTAFRNPENFNISLKKFPLVPSAHSRVTHFLGVLSSFERSTESTEISELLTKAYATMDIGLKKTYPMALEYLKRALYKRNIQTVENIPQTSTDILKFFREVQINPANLYLLDEGLNLTVPVFDSQTLVGYGYDILKDKPLFSSPFDLTLLAASDIGFQIPDAYICERKNQLKNVFHTFVSKEDCSKARLSSLDVQEEFLSPKFLEEMSLKPGMNIDNGENTRNLTSVVEYQTFLFTLKAKPDVSMDFIGVVENLPVFNDTDWGSVEAWKNFFATYGTHYIKSAYGGASMEIQVETETDDLTDTNSTDTDTLFTKREKLTATLSSIMELIANSLIRKSSTVNISSKYSIKYKGGNYKYFVNNLTQSDAIQIMEYWRDSFTFEPVMLENDLTLVPISELVMKIDEDIGVELEKAVKALFNFSLVYKPALPKLKPQTPVSRENINLQGLTGDYTMMKEFATVFRTLADQSRQANENFLALMMQQQKDIQQQTEEDREERKRQMLLEMEKLRIQEEEAKHKRNMEMELKRIEAEKEVVKAKFETEMQLERIKLENEAAAQAEEQRIAQQENFMKLIIAQNQINAQRKPWYESLIDFGKQSIQSIGPLLMAAGAAG